MADYKCLQELDFVFTSFSSFQDELFAKIDSIGYLEKELQITSISNFESVCSNFSQSIRGNDRTTSLQALFSLSQFFYSNKKIKRLESSAFAISKFIEIFERSELFDAIKFIFPMIFSQRDLDFLIHLLYFLYKLYNCNSYFGPYLSNKIFLELILSIHQIVTIEQPEVHSLFFPLLSGVFQYISIETIDQTFLISEILRYLLFISDSHFIQLSRIPFFIYNIIQKVDFNFNVYSFFIQLFTKKYKSDEIEDSCITTESFLNVVSSLYLMITKSSSDEIIELILVNQIHSKLYDIYDNNDDLISTFPIFLTLINEILKFFVRNKEISQDLLIEKEKILKFFTYRTLLKKLDESDSKSSSAILEFASILIDMNSIMEVFKKQGAFVDFVIDIYGHLSENSKEKALQLFLKMIEYSKFFRKRILSIDLSDTLILFLYNKYDSQINLVIQFIEICLHIFSVKQEMPPILEGLFSDEDFMPTFIEAMEETPNEELKLRMQIALSQFEQILNQ